MAILQPYSGTATVGTTEYDLTNNSTVKATQTTQGVYQLFLDLGELTSTEQYTLKIYEKAVAGATQKLVETVVFSGAQAEPLYVTPSIILLHGWTFTLQKNFGTDRAITWSIRQAS